MPHKCSVECFAFFIWILEFFHKRFLDITLVDSLSYDNQIGPKTQLLIGKFYNTRMCFYGQVRVFF